ncbi:hypothetical protein Hneap_0951 [Halothiobacillus neapolitanus c2]|uniref:Uncharacterized protein n=1 Tax=Halothiobacillus neapolitanus (strain ATCC 23641 / DSM 15147 / CIP 104769 / NCIMB 8539 / c2) TaxID=555778 RepID=D0KZB8_HALNC|nr:hypothetical protein Hneap_0951 [Halothiobacillus neapolitanus c2]
MEAWDYSAYNSESRIVDVPSFAPVGNSMPIDGLLLTQQATRRLLRAAREGRHYLSIDSADTADRHRSPHIVSARLLLPRRL